MACGIAIPTSILLSQRACEKDSEKEPPFPHELRRADGSATFKAQSLVGHPNLTPALFSS
ncbi:hypothetical protein GE21DRAFT_1216358 [Neurospora crassa]|nr:hypothetical protein GE21DRAFT_1216358 [Neurospora crassa]